MKIIKPLTTIKDKSSYKSGTLNLTNWESIESQGQVHTALDHRVSFDALAIKINELIEGYDGIKTNELKAGSGASISTSGKISTISFDKNSISVGVTGSNADLKFKDVKISPQTGYVSGTPVSLPTKTYVDLQIGNAVTSVHRHIGSVTIIDRQDALRKVGMYESGNDLQLTDGNIYNKAIAKQGDTLILVPAPGATVQAETLGVDANKDLVPYTANNNLTDSIFELETDITVNGNDIASLLDFEKENLKQSNDKDITGNIGKIDPTGTPTHPNKIARRADVGTGLSDLNNKITSVNTAAGNLTKRVTAVETKSQANDVLSKKNKSSITALETTTSGNTSGIATNKTSITDNTTNINDNSSKITADRIKLKTWTDVAHKVLKTDDLTHIVKHLGLHTVLPAHANKVYTWTLPAACKTAGFKVGELIEIKLASNATGKPSIYFDESFNDGHSTDNNPAGRSLKVTLTDKQLKVEVGNEDLSTYFISRMQNIGSLLANVDEDARQSAATAISNAATAKAAADKANSDIVALKASNANVPAAITKNATDIKANKTEIAAVKVTANAAYTDAKAQSEKTRVDGELNTKQNKDGNQSLNTKSKSIVGAINEVKATTTTELSKKQDASIPKATTNAKTVAGAIDELDGRVQTNNHDIHDLNTRKVDNSNTNLDSMDGTTAAKTLASKKYVDDNKSITDLSHLITQKEVFDAVDKIGYGVYLLRVGGQVEVATLITNHNDLKRFYMSNGRGSYLTDAHKGSTSQLSDSLKQWDVSTPGSANHATTKKYVDDLVNKHKVTLPKTITLIKVDGSHEDIKVG